jgi:hypothetical protein
LEFLFAGQVQNTRSTKKCSPSKVNRFCRASNKNPLLVAAQGQTLVQTAVELASEFANCPGFRATANWSVSGRIFFSVKP